MDVSEIVLRINIKLIDTAFLEFTIASLLTWATVSNLSFWHHHVSP
jgi:hypothetical protein